MTKIQTQIAFLKFTHESAIARLTLWEDGTGHLSGVYSRDRGKGHATQLVTDIMKFADHNQIPLLLEVSNYGPESQERLSNEKLEAFYTKFGFERTKELGDPLLMKRAPSQEKHTL